MTADGSVGTTSGAVDHHIIAAKLRRARAIHLDHHEMPLPIRLARLRLVPAVTPRLMSPFIDNFVAASHPA